MIVTIDGPAGSGKSSAAKGLAERLGFERLDTGAMYRAVALAVLRAQIDEDDHRAIAALLERTRIDMKQGHVFLHDENVSKEIRTPELSQAASRVAAIPLVRTDLVARQRAIGQGRNMVSEGRDQGTIVFPDAVRKFFFVANPLERARRRLTQLLAKGEMASLDEILADQETRDRRDAGREIGPMTSAPDAILIDTTHLTLAQVIDCLEREVRQCVPG